MSLRLPVASGILLALSLGPGSVSADVYTWVDESGTVHFSEEPPPKRSRRAKKVILPDDVPPPDAVNALAESPAAAGGSPTPAAAPAQAAPVRKPLPRVELFSTSWCPHCKRARAFLQTRGVPFVEHDIETEPGAAERLKALTGGQAIPAAIIGDKLVRGFSPSEYQGALALP